jgi:hypothetical protein
VFLAPWSVAHSTKAASIYPRLFGYFSQRAPVFAGFLALAATKFSGFFAAGFK